MGTKNDPGKFDCYESALPHEPMFVLLARDPDAPLLVREWALRREHQIGTGQRPESDRAMVAEAMECVEKMKSWRRANDGAWRKPQTRRQKAPEGECRTCDEQRAKNDDFHPPHDASDSCESGKHNHCSCDLCF